MGAYGGDAELRLVEGDHNSTRPVETMREIAYFFCRAFRCDDILAQHSAGLLDCSRTAEQDFAVDDLMLRARTAAMQQPTFAALQLKQRVDFELLEPVALEGALQLTEEG